MPLPGSEPREIGQQVPVTMPGILGQTDNIKETLINPAIDKARSSIQNSGDLTAKLTRILDQEGDRLARGREKVLINNGLMFVGTFTVGYFGSKFLKGWINNVWYGEKKNGTG